MTKAFEKVLRAKGMIPELPAKGSASSVVLPIPPSTNALFLAGKGYRTKTPEYREWIERAFPLAESLAPPKSYPVMIVVTVIEAVNRQRDIDNFLKPTIDLIKKAGAIKNDNLCHVTDVLGRYRPEEGGKGIRVHFEELK